MGSSTSEITSRTLCDTRRGRNPDQAGGAGRTLETTALLLLEQRLEGRLWVDRGVGVERNRRNNPMQSNLPMHLSPRCRARTRAGTPCRSPAMTNGRCRMHGGTSPGAPKSNGHALEHGRYTAEAIAEQREFTAFGEASFIHPAGRIFQLSKPKSSICTGENQLHRV
jgi:hypothetical protein